MYACIHQTAPDRPLTAELQALAGAFSPVVETAGERTVVFPIDGLGRLFGPPDQLAAEIARRGAEMGLAANLAIAAQPDTAVLAARHLPGVHWIRPGEEARSLAPIPLKAMELPEELRRTLKLWGLRTLGDVAELPPIGLAERLGEEGVRLYELATGRAVRPLHLDPPESRYEETVELDDPLENLQPLLFLLSRSLGELCRRLQGDGRAANGIRLELRLEDGGRHERILELPVPQAGAEALGKILRLDLEAHPPPAPVTAVRLEMRPADPRPAQHGLFLPPAPPPDKLQLTLARLEALVGKGNLGSPVLLDTHRPGAFAIQPFAPREEGAGRAEEIRAPAPEGPPRLAMRRYEPPLPARVRLRAERPAYLSARGIAGEVADAAGPWRISGEWWDARAWARDEWDVQLARGGVYRIYCTLDTRAWFVEGVYD